MGNNYSNNVSLSEAGSEEEWENVSNVDYCEDDDEVLLDEDEEFIERLRILEDAKQLKQLAKMFMHPELPVEVDPAACARCYYDRASAPMQETKEEMEEHDRVMSDVAEMRRLARDYLHPELSVVTSDPAACARCYYDRASAPMQETKKEMEEKNILMDDIENLKRLAKDYLHPELVPVSTSDPAACARCYYDRVSAPMQETMEEMEEHDRVLSDVAEMRRLARDYLHPELPVVTSDLAACARCYYDRASAPVQDSFEEAEQHHEVLVDALNLKNLAEKVKHLSISSNKVNPSTTLSAAEMAKNKLSVSSVNLYGLDDDFFDAALF